ncbi:MAG: hypothetical protein AAFZ80_13735, partial [Cyanobacteria bacterium P01_A01_bin.105]
GITVQKLDASNNFELRVEISISRSAAVGTRNFQVITPEGNLDSQTFDLSFQVKPRPSSPPPKPRPYPYPYHSGALSSPAIGGDLL